MLANYGGKPGEESEIQVVRHSTPKGQLRGVQITASRSTTPN